MFQDQIAQAIAAAHGGSALDQLARQLWAANAARLIGDDEAQGLAELIAAKRPARVIGAIPGTAPPRPSRFPPRRPQLARRHPERIARRRRIAAAGPMPPALAATFTISEIAVLAVIADEVAQHGRCERSLDELAARAGTCRTMARRAIRAAARAGIVAVEVRPQPGRKNLPNVIRVISPEWSAWIARRPRRDRGQINAPHGFPNKKPALHVVAMKGNSGAERGKTSPHPVESASPPA